MAWVKPGAVCAAICAGAVLVGAVRAAADEPQLQSLRPEFFVAAESPDAGNTPLTLGVARELEREAQTSLGTTSAPWFLPKPGWKTSELVSHCGDPQALGGVVLTYYHGYATHFYLLWQSETSTFDISATVIACRPQPTIVGVVNELPGANGTPWVVRRSQVSIPLVTVAGYATLIANRKGNNNINSAALIGALFGGTASRDIPGYSDPVRLRAAAQHIGDDLVTALGAVCATHDDVADVSARTGLCRAIGYKP